MLRSVEHMIRRNVDDRNRMRGARSSNMFRAQRVDGVSDGRLDFRFVDRCIRSGIDDNIGMFPRNHRGHRPPVGKIKFRSADRYYLSPNTVSRFQEAARQLTLTASDENLHLASHLTAASGRFRLPASPSRSPA
jgi:hypothetical protein